MGSAIALRGDFDSRSLRQLAKATKDAGQSRRLRSAMDNHVHRPTQMGSWVLINAGWYNTKERWRYFAGRPVMPRSRSFTLSASNPLT